jgi:tRNA-Thr(GGU) m(6)t(6)A37 methyltransferase TsaA
MHFFTPIGHYKGPIKTKFGLPRQGRFIENLKGKIYIHPKYAQAEAFRGLEDFSHLWLIWLFSENLDKGSHPTVRPPRLEGNKRMGVFATRSPFRPNGIGMSAVKLEGITHEDGNIIIEVSGADLMDRTPILDIKPYIPYADSIPDALAGPFQAQPPTYPVRWEVADEKADGLSEEDQALILAIVSQDPRPAYKSKKVHDDKTYVLTYETWDVSFRAQDGMLKIVDLKKLEPEEAEDTPYWVYMLLCNDDTIYTGMAKDPEKRLAVHNAGRGAKYTRSRRPCRLAYQEQVKNRSEALIREAQIKRYSRSKKLQMIDAYRAQKP